MTAPAANDRVGRHGFQLVLCSLSILPLLANMVSLKLGYVVFYLADPKFQSVWGTLCLLLGLWALGGRDHTRGRFGFLLLLAALLGLGLYVRSLMAVFVTPPAGPLTQVVFFGTESGLMLFVAASRLWVARGNGRL